MTKDSFKQFEEFDRSLEDFRNDVAFAHLTARDSIKRYLAMMSVLDAMFLLYYEDMPTSEQAELREAIEKLVGTVSSVIDDDKVVPIKKP